MGQTDRTNIGRKSGSIGRVGRAWKGATGLLMVVEQGVRRDLALSAQG